MGGIGTEPVSHRWFVGGTGTSLLRRYRRCSSRTHLRVSVYARGNSTTNVIAGLEDHPESGNRGQDGEFGSRNALWDGGQGELDVRKE